MSKEIEQNPSRVAFDPRGVDVAALDRIADNRGESRAEVIRSELKDLIARHADADGGNAELHRPDSEPLADAYDKLLALSDHPLGTRRVPVEEAEAQLWTQDTPKNAVRSRLLAPLADTGFISVTNGQITVHRRTEGAVEAAEAEADRAESRLDAAEAFADVRPSREPQHKELRKYRMTDLQPPFRLCAWVCCRTLWGAGGD